jgi:hypothetical protein
MSPQRRQGRFQRGGGRGELSARSSHPKETTRHGTDSLSSGNALGGHGAVKSESAGSTISCSLYVPRETTRQTQSFIKACFQIKIKRRNSNARAVSAVTDTGFRTQPQGCMIKNRTIFAGI